MNKNNSKGSNNTCVPDDVFKVPQLPKKTLKRIYNSPGPSNDKNISIDKPVNVPDTFSYVNDQSSYEANNESSTVDVDDLAYILKLLNDTEATLKLTSECSSSVVISQQTESCEQKLDGGETLMDEIMKLAKSSTYCKNSHSNTSIFRMKELIHEEEVFEVPKIVIDSEFILENVLSMKSFTKLTDESKEHLMKFLPQHNNDEDEELLLKTAFSTDKKLINEEPVKKLQMRLKNGYYSTSEKSRRTITLDNKLVRYQHFYRLHQINLFRRLLTNRMKLMSLLSTANRRKDLGTRENSDTKTIQTKTNLLCQRSQKRIKIMLSDFCGKYNLPAFLNNQDNFQQTPAIPKPLLVPCHKSTLNKIKYKDLDLHQPTDLPKLKFLLKQYKRLKLRNPNSPSLFIQGLKLKKIFQRSGMTSQYLKVIGQIKELKLQLAKKAS